MLEAMIPALLCGPWFQYRTGRAQATSKFKDLSFIFHSINREDTIRLLRCRQVEGQDQADECGHAYCN